MHYLNYNIPSNNRELQLIGSNLRVLYDYNIPSNNRELQPGMRMHCGHSIITYQVITGNYSKCRVLHSDSYIITYQVITGNYSMG